MAPDESEGEYADRTFYGLLAILLLLGIGVAILMARGDISGPELFTQDQAIIGLALCLFVVVLVLVVLLFRLATIHREMRAVQAEVKTMHHWQGGTGQDVIAIEGIGEVYAKRLHDVGLPTIPALVDADTNQVADSIEVEPGLVKEWQDMGRLIRITGIGPQYAEVLVRAGVRSESALAKAKAKALANKINKLAAERKVRITGAAIQEGRVQGWISAAKRKKHDW